MGRSLGLAVTVTVRRVVAAAVTVPVLVRRVVLVPVPVAVRCVVTVTVAVTVTCVVAVPIPLAVGHASTRRPPREARPVTAVALSRARYILPPDDRGLLKLLGETDAGRT